MDLSDEEAEKLRLLDNKLNESEWDLELLKDLVPSIDFSDFEINFNLPEEVEDINLDDFFEDAPPKEKEPKKIQCPHCGEWFEV